MIILQNSVIKSNSFWRASKHGGAGLGFWDCSTHMQADEKICGFKKRGFG